MVQAIKRTKPTPLHLLNMQSSQNEVNVISLYSNTINDNSKCWHRVPSCLNLTFLLTILSTPKQIMAIMMMKILSILTKKRCIHEVLLFCDSLIATQKCHNFCTTLDATFTKQIISTRQTRSNNNNQKLNMDWKVVYCEQLSPLK